MTIADDISFAKGSLGPGGEFRTIAPMLRYVAALNPGASRDEFIAACVAAGYHAGSARNRFNESRLFDTREWEMKFDNDGREIQ